jgi:hypothetical protein
MGFIKSTRSFPAVMETPAEAYVKRFGCCFVRGRDRALERIRFKCHPSSEVQKEKVPMGNIAAELGAFEVYLGNTFIGPTEGVFEGGCRGRNRQDSPTSGDNLAVLVERCPSMENGHSCRPRDIN